MASRKPSPPANADIFPHSGTIFIDHSRYVYSKIKAERKKIAKSLILIAGILLFSGYWGYISPPTSPAHEPNLVAFYQFIFWLMIGLLPMRLFVLKPYFKLKKVARTNPLLRISHEGISWWENPNLNISWADIGVFILKQSKIYALPRIAIFKPNTPHMPLMCIDTALLDVKRKDLLAYFEARLIVEHKQPAPNKIN